MSDAKEVVLARLQELREALSQEPISDVVTKARHQCDRLEHGLALAHHEGIRFAAHTLLKLLEGNGPSEAVRTARSALEAALQDGQFPS